MDDLVDRLNAEANHIHTPMLLREAAAAIYALRRHTDKLQTELHEARNVRRSDDHVGLVCATCGLPVETEPCPMHSPLSWQESMASARNATASRPLPRCGRSSPKSPLDAAPHCVHSRYSYTSDEKERRRMEEHECQRCGDKTPCLETEEEDGWFCLACLNADADYWIGQRNKAQELAEAAR